MNPPRPKRQKVTIACDPCRARKIKCDGLQPVCEPCQKKTTANGATCSWKSGLDRLSSQFLGNVTHRAGEGRDLDISFQRQSSLNARGETSSRTTSQQSPSIALPVNISTYHGTSPELDLARVDVFNRSITSNITGMRHIQEPTQRHVHQPRQRQAQEPIEQPNEVSPSEHSVHAIIGNMDEGSRAGFFGSSSAGTFMQSVKEMVQQKMGNVSEEHASSPLYMQIRTLPNADQK